MSAATETEELVLIQEIKETTKDVNLNLLTLKEIEETNKSEVGKNILSGFKFLKSVWEVK
jgi:hypothetical protein